jgi:hypothetical protein
MNQPEFHVSQRQSSNLVSYYNPEIKKAIKDRNLKCKKRGKGEGGILGIA